MTVLLVIALLATAADGVFLVVYAIKSARSRREAAEIREDEAVDECLENAEILVDLAVREIRSKQTRVA